MIDEKTRKQIEAYIPSLRDKSLGVNEYYVNQNGRVKRGHWICHADAGVTECSVCHNDVSEYVEYPRCMFCGAKMD